MARNIAPQDVTWFLDLNERERLDLSPPYQRKSIWSPKERKYFLDTVFNGYPCPPLFLYKSITDKGITTFHVVDGKQRLETIISYANNKIAIPADFTNKELAGKKFKQLTVEQRKIFWNYQFAVELLDVVDPATVKEIFGRYNRTAKNLEPQELRHAKYDGWFITFAEAEAKKAEWNKYGISTTARARRMRDVQFISELMMSVLAKGEPIGFDQDVIETYYADYDTPSEFDDTFSEEDFSSKFERVKNVIDEMEQSNNSITTHAKSSTHFFSIWTVLANESLELPTSPLLADRYNSFMGLVAELAQAEEAIPVSAEENPHFLKPLEYLQNSRGANTEEPQRLKRNQILIDALIG